MPWTHRWRRPVGSGAVQLGERGGRLGSLAARWMETIEKITETMEKTLDFSLKNVSTKYVFVFFGSKDWDSMMILMVIQQNGGIMASVWMQYVLGI